MSQMHIKPADWNWDQDTCTQAEDLHAQHSDALMSACQGTVGTDAHSLHTAAI